MSEPETADERRARKAREREENAQRIRAELDRDFLQPLPERMSFHDCQLEHTRLRAKIMEMQTLVVQGKLDVKREQDLEKLMVEQVHRVEEKARTAGSGGYVPKPGD